MCEARLECFHIKVSSHNPAGQLYLNLTPLAMHVYTKDTTCIQSGLYIVILMQCSRPGHLKHAHMHFHVMIIYKPWSNSLTTPHYVIVLVSTLTNYPVHSLSLVEAVVWRATTRNWTYMCIRSPKITHIFFHPNKVIYIINGRGERFLYSSVNAHKKKKTLQLYEMAGKEWIQAMS